MDASDYKKVLTFDEMTSPDIGKAIAENAAILVTMGATEQHAGHLPLGSDTMQGIDLAKRVVAQLRTEGIPVIVGPALPYGPRGFLSETPKKLPGNIHLKSQTLMAVLDEILRELIDQGFRRLYILGFHAESDAPMQIVAKEISETTQANVVTLNWLVGARPRYSHLMTGGKPQGHGGEGETARMLVTAPHLCRMEEARSWHPTVRENLPHADALPYLGGAVGRYKMEEPFFEGFEEGITGDPQLATPELGEEVYRITTDWLCDVIRFDFAGSGDFSRSEL